MAHAFAYPHTYPLTHPNPSNTHLKVAVDPAVGVEVAERVGEEGEDGLGQREVDPLLQQHNGEVPLTRRLP